MSVGGASVSLSDLGCLSLSLPYFLPLHVLATTRIVSSLFKRLTDYTAGTRSFRGPGPFCYCRRVRGCDPDTFYGMGLGSPPLSIATPVTGGDNYSGVPLASSSLLPGHVSKLLSAPDVVSELPKRSVSPLRNNAWLSPVVVREKLDTKASPSSREEPSAFETLASFLGRGFG